jgi:hypothetical protein
LVQSYIENKRGCTELKDGLAIKAFTEAALRVREEDVFKAIERIIARQKNSTSDMKRTKEIGYDLVDVVWRNINHFDRLWNATDVETKDKIVNGIGELAVTLASGVDTEIKTALALQNVSKRSELLIGLLTMLEKEGGNEFIDKAEIVAKYEANL